MVMNSPNQAIETFEESLNNLVAELNNQRANKQKGLVS